MNLPFPYDFIGQTSVVTGGARGFGLAFAAALTRAGSTVIIADLDHAQGAIAAQGLASQGLAVTFFALDVRDPDRHHALAAEVVARHGRLDLWINNAGIARHARSETLTTADWSLQLDIMLSGTFFGAQAAGRQMLSQGQGRIINIASVNGFLAQAGRAAYVAAKAGVVRLTEVLAAEWGPRGVIVNGIAPAVIMTDLVKASIADGSARLDLYRDRSPMARLGEPDEVVAAMMFLASRYAQSINGHTLKVDGAWCADRYLPTGPGDRVTRNAADATP